MFWWAPKHGWRRRKEHLPNKKNQRTLVIVLSEKGILTRGGGIAHHSRITLGVDCWLLDGSEVDKQSNADCAADYWLPLLGMCVYLFTRGSAIVLYSVFKQKLGRRVQERPLFFCGQQISRHAGSPQAKPHNKTFFTNKYMNKSDTPTTPRVNQPEYVRR